MPAIIAYEDINENYKYYHNQLLKVIDKHAPYVTSTKEERKWINKPWIGKRIQKLIKEKSKLYSKYVKKQSNFWYNRYRVISDIIKKNISDSKKHYFTWYFQTNMDKTLNSKF